MDVPGDEIEGQIELDQAGETVRTQFATFLRTFRGNGGADAMPIYVEELLAMRAEDRTTLYVDYRHVVASDALLAEMIQAAYYRFEPQLRRAVQDAAKDALVAAGEGVAELADNALWVGFFGLPSLCKLRELKSAAVGQLVCLSATVTRTTEVRPELLWGTFQCLDCLTESANVEQQFKYTEPARCKNPACQNARRWLLLVEKSVFADWQKCHVQENSWEIPSGSMPRTLDVILRNEDVELAKPGEKCLFTGTVIVVPDVSKLTMSRGVTAHRGMDGDGTSAVGVAGGVVPPASSDAAEGVSGLKDLGASRQLTYKLCFLACSVQRVGGKDRLNAAVDEESEDGTGMADPEEMFTVEERAAVR
jgi:DNA replication licensing factor MCM6